ncbi:30S ribosomal protein S16 [Rhodoflexus sp.]
MAVKIRLARRGRKKLAIYDIVVADARSPRDGRFIEKIGIYNPNTNPASIELNGDKALQWLMNGAQPTDTARRILSYKGVLMRKHLQVGVIKGAITQEQADARYSEWMKGKEAQIQAKIDSLKLGKEADKKAKLAAEAKVKEARAESIRQKQSAAEPVAQADVPTAE